jgi:hypothetical protein
VTRPCALCKRRCGVITADQAHRLVRCERCGYSWHEPNKTPWREQDHAAAFAWLTKENERWKRMLIDKLRWWK